MPSLSSDDRNYNGIGLIVMGATSEWNEVGLCSDDIVGVSSLVHGMCMSKRSAEGELRWADVPRLTAWGKGCLPVRIRDSCTCQGIA